MIKKGVRIWLDMDGVIVNLTKSICTALNEEYDRNAIYENYSWLKDRVGAKRFYYPFKSESFWAHAEKFAWAEELVKEIYKLDRNFLFLSKISPHAECLSGKYIWMQNHFPKYINKLVFCPSGQEKGIFCHNHDILIDDSEKNCNSWEKNGGKAFKWTEIGSSREDIAKNYIEDIKKLVESVKDYNG